MEIIPKVHVVTDMRGVNVYLLLGSRLALVDTGMPGSDEAILSCVEDLGFTAADLAQVIVTHHHLDHVGGLAAIKKRTGARVLAHPADAPCIAGEQAPPPPSSAVMRVLSRVMAAVMPHAAPAQVDVPIQDGDRLDLLGGATVVHVPGHTPGSIALHFPSERLLICGDAIDHRRSRLGPPPKPFTEDVDQALDSLQRMAELEFDVLCPGHGAPIVSGADAQVRAMVRALA